MMLIIIFILILLFIVAMMGICYAAFFFNLLGEEYKTKEWEENDEYDFGHDVRYYDIDEY
jgi:flagellar basal body-associated protein FliL